MKIQSKFSFSGLFILGLAIFSSGLQAIARSMAYGGKEFNFVAENWIFPSTYLFAFVFALGWLAGGLGEYFLLNERRRFAIVLFWIMLIAYAVVGLSSFFVSGFPKPMLEASSAMIYCGFIFRLSVMKSEVIAKIRTHNRQPANS